MDTQEKVLLFVMISVFVSILLVGFTMREVCEIILRIISRATGGLTI